MYLTTSTGNHECITPYNWECDINQLAPTGHWIATRQKFGKREHWFSAPMFIDTETSHVSEFDGWIHQWAVEWGDKYIIGRTAIQLTAFLQNVSNWAKSKGQKWFVMGYIHNMGYDMEYLRSFFPDEEPEFFAVKPHRILTARWKQIEIRCSYLLTNKALAKWGKDSKSRYPKLTGAYDYGRIITPETPLTELDWAYQLNDVACMSSAWYNDRGHDGYDTTTVPMTSTGFVRADCRNAAFETPYWKRKLNTMQPGIEVYNALEQAFAGGETHGNRFYKDMTVHGTIGHRDFASSYPARQMLNCFPMGQFIEDDVKTFGDVKRLMRSNCLLLHLYLRNPELKDRSISAPYLSISKCIPHGKTDEYLDNGRVIKIDGVVSLWVTEYDFILIMRQYKCDYQIVKSHVAPKGKLPQWFRTKIMEYYQNKTRLKHSDPRTYMESKAMLNGIYGMTAEKFVREIITYSGGEWEVRPPDEMERDSAYMKKVNHRNTFLPFAWGVWTTALARYALNECMELVGWDNFLYADTDSIFYISTPEIEKKLDAYNKDIQAQAVQSGAYVDWEGKRYYLGEFLMEDDAPISQFRFVHAKCYAVIDCKGKLGVTIAGVTKTQRTDPKKTNADELGNIENLTAGFVFRECGGTRITYNNKLPHILTIDGEEIVCAASAVISNTEYEITDMNALDEDDDAILSLLRGDYMSDTYGDYIGIK